MFQERNGPLGRICSPFFSGLGDVNWWYSPFVADIWELGNFVWVIYACVSTVTHQVIKAKGMTVPCAGNNGKGLLDRQKDPCGGSGEQAGTPEK